MRVVTHNAVRKPWGQGKAAVQKYRRNNLAFEIAGLLTERLDEETAQCTGQLLPRGGLKRKSSRKLFDWVHDPKFKGNARVFTKPLLRLVIKKILREVGPIPMDPKKSYGTFVGQQAKRLGVLIRKAKRIKAK